MPRFIVFLLLLLAGLSRAASAQTAGDLPARPVPFTFVTDQANLLSAADAKKLEGGLRNYAEKTGTQVVVVTVPSLGGRDVADYGRALGTAWGVGQRAKNNGIVVLLGAQEHKVTIQPGSGLRSVITPEVTSRVIGQDMTPAFKQGNYFAGLRKGLNTLMLTANPSSDPRKDHPAAAAGSTPATTTPDVNLANTPAASAPSPAVSSDPTGVQQTEAPASSPGLGMGTLLIGALIIGGILWFVIRLFRRKPAGTTPDFMGNGNPGNRPAGPGPNQSPDFLGNRPATGYPQGPGYGAAPSSGSGMGGMLATGAAAAAGAYLGNRMASGHDTGNSGAHNLDTNSNAGFGTGAGAAAGAAGTGAAGDYFSSHNDAANADNAPDYFSNDAPADNSSGDYFSSDNSSYDDTSSDDTGGGGFDSTDNNSGSW